MSIKLIFNPFKKIKLIFNNILHLEKLVKGHETIVKKLKYLYVYSDTLKATYIPTKKYNEKIFFIRFL